MVPRQHDVVPLAQYRGQQAQFLNAQIRVLGPRRRQHFIEPLLLVLKQTFRSLIGLLDAAPHHDGVELQADRVHFDLGVGVVLKQTVEPNAFLGVVSQRLVALVLLSVFPQLLFRDKGMHKHSFFQA